MLWFLKKFHPIKFFLGATWILNKSTNKTPAWIGLKANLGRILRPGSTPRQGSSHTQAPWSARDSWRRCSWSPSWSLPQATSPRCLSPRPRQPHRSCRLLTLFRIPSDIAPLSDENCLKIGAGPKTEELTSAKKWCSFAYRFANSINSGWSGAYCSSSP